MQWDLYRAEFAFAGAGADGKVAAPSKYRFHISDGNAFGAFHHFFWHLISFLLKCRRNDARIQYKPNHVLLSTKRLVNMHMILQTAGVGSAFP